MPSIPWKADPLPFDSRMGRGGVGPVSGDGVGVIGRPTAAAPASAVVDSEAPSNPRRPPPQASAVTSRPHATAGPAAAAAAAKATPPLRQASSKVVELKSATGQVSVLVRGGGCHRE